MEVAVTERVQPTLFHSKLCLKPEELGSLEFYASLYQFQRLCWEEKSPPRPWSASPLPQGFDPTSSKLMEVDLYKLFLSVIKNGGSDYITHNYRWGWVGAKLDMTSNLARHVYETLLLAYEVYSNMVRSCYYGYAISPTHSECDSTGRHATYDDLIWSGNKKWVVHESTRHMLNLTSHPLKDYESLCPLLTARIIEGNSKASEKLAEGDVEYPEPVAGKEVINPAELSPEDSGSVSSVSGLDSESQLSVTPYLSLRQEFLQLARQSSLLEGDIDDPLARKYTPPPSLCQEKVEDQLPFDDGIVVEQFEWRTKELDPSELPYLARWGLSPRNYRPGEEETGSPDFKQWIWWHGIERAKDVWREWLREDPGLVVNDD